MDQMPKIENFHIIPYYCCSRIIKNFLIIYNFFQGCCPISYKENFSLELIYYNVIQQCCIETSLNASCDFRNCPPFPWHPMILVF